MQSLSVTTANNSSSNQSVDQYLDHQKLWIKKEMDSLVETLFVHLKSKFDHMLETNNLLCSVIPDLGLNPEFFLSPKPNNNNNNDLSFGTDINLSPNGKTVKQEEIVGDNFSFGSLLNSNAQFNQMVEPLSPDQTVSKFENSEFLLKELPALSTTINPVDSTIDFDELEIQIDSESDSDYKDSFMDFNNFTPVKKEIFNPSDDDSKGDIENSNFDFIEEHMEDMKFPQSTIDKEEEMLMNENEKLEEEEEDGDDQPAILITNGLSCLLETCELIFESKNELNQHMSDAHAILPYRCIIADCGQSFSTHDQLVNHVEKKHSRLTEWKCSKCPKAYRKESQLFFHMAYSHQSGIFRCAAKGCNFEGRMRKSVYRHFEQHHQRFTCLWSNCGKSFKQNHHLKAHERIHKGIKPFRCKWDNCRYASVDRANVIRHIRGKHFNLPQTVKEQMARHIKNTLDPKKYLEVSNELLT